MTSHSEPSRQPRAVSGEPRFADAARIPTGSLGCRHNRNERPPERSTSARRRRVLVRWLRRTANHRPAHDPTRRRGELLLCDRVAVVRSELLEIADLLERTDDPDPACVAELHGLLSDGCESPLYNPEIHISELRATLHYIRAGLAASAPSAAKSPRRSVGGIRREAV
jgi:hypothetical protein